MAKAKTVVATQTAPTSTAAVTPKAETAGSGSVAPAIRILKIATAPSLSGKSQLQYCIGCTADGDIQLRVLTNTGGGYFNSLWAPLTGIQKLLASVPSGKTITSFVLSPMFSGKSVNTAAFLFAVLLHEGLVQASKDKKRCYELTTDAAAKFFAGVKALIESGVALAIPVKPQKADAKGTKGMPKKEAATAAPLPVENIPVQQSAPIANQPWPISKKSPKAASKKM